MEEKKTVPRIPIRFADRINVVMDTVYVPEIHLILSFDRRLDRLRLARALRLLLDAEPVLSCRFAPHWRKPKWERIPEDELSRATLLSIEECDGPGAEAALADFFAERIPVEKGPLISCLLISCEGCERLVIKIHHATSDAGGFKYLAERLATIYRKLSENPEFRPEQNDGSRSLAQVYRGISLRGLLAIFLRGLSDIWHGVVPFRSLQVPSATRASLPLAFRFTRFDPKESAAIIRAGARFSATANDVFVTAFLRALKKLAGERNSHALRVAGTVDLRRYLPGRQADALCQVSGLFTIVIGAALDADFNDTLARVKAEINKQKSRNFGLGMIFFLRATFGLQPWFVFRRFIPAFWKLGYRDGNVPPGFTNLGPIPVSDFGDARLVMAEMTTPGSVPPFFFAGLSGFAGTFCVSAGFHPDAIQPQWVEDFLSAIRQELQDFVRENRD